MAGDAQRLTYWRVSLVAAAATGEDRYDVARRGQAIQTPDALIAAVARAHGAILVTEKTKDFPIADITLMSLR
jgi:predicted nucleic acid-binding protein